MQLDTIVQTIRTSEPSDWQIEHRGETQVAFYINDVNLRIETTLDGPDIQAKPFVESWATSHADKNATGYFFNIYYGQTLVAREILVSVDGARALIPLPDQHAKTISEYQYKIGQIYANHGSLDDYMGRCGITVA